jgi:DNA helicase IV
MAGGPEDDELERERAHLTASRAAFARMLDEARTQVVIGENVAGDRFSLESLGRHLKSRAKELAEEPAGAMFFGRLDFGAAAAAGDHRGQRYYIGRRHITGDAGRPMVIDWRAPVARVFYQATARDPQGVSARRRFGWAMGGADPAVLTGFEDEYLERGEDLGAASRIVGAEIERPRTGPMRDIIATIQPEQDELVRADLEESICVQGAPGTGKTAVGLHRAAYLLYRHRPRLERAGVLVIGPNPAFLRYIAAVLPALGEVDVEQTTVEELPARHPVRSGDDAAAAAVKHDPRMAQVLHRALYGRLREPAEPISVPDGSYRWRVSVEEVGRLVDDVRRSPVPYAVGRERVRSRTVELLRRQAEARGQTPGTAWMRRIGRSESLTRFLDTVWPAVRPEELVVTLLGDATQLARAADGSLTAEERMAILWTRPPRTAKSAKWSAADLVLIDEVAGLIERPRAFGHVIVDEAQDLSPMQCRMIARRSEHGSITVLGDLAQGTTPWAARNWPDHLGHLGKPKARVVALTTGFRVPDAVLTLAGRLLGALRVEVPEARSLRRDGGLRVRAVSDLPAATVAAVREALARDGSIAVIAAESAVARATAALAAAGIGTAPAGEIGGTARVTVLPASLAKGLEYDHVIVTEPAEIVEAEARGLSRLYVVLTRAVSRLDVLHARPLPAPLVRADPLPSGLSPEHISGPASRD